MIPYRVFQHIDLRIVRLYWYGVFAAIGFFVALKLAMREARKQKISETEIENISLLLLISGIVGARLGEIFFYWSPEIPITFWSVIAVWEGGLAWFGGFIAAVIMGFVYVRIKKLDFWKYADLFTIPLIVGHIFGRIGDYISGGHAGKITTLPWAIWLEGASRHPVVLYELIGLTVILLILRWLKSKNLVQGQLFLYYVRLYSIQRLFLDFFRLETTDPRTLGLTPSQWLVIFLYFTATTIFFIQQNKKNNILIVKKK